MRRFKLEDSRLFKWLIIGMIFMGTQVYSDDCVKTDYNSETVKSQIVLSLDEELAGGYNQVKALPQLLNQATAEDFFRFTNNADVADKVIMQMQFSSETALSGLELKHSTSTAYLKSGTSVKIQGSTNGSTWIDVSDPITSEGSICRQTQIHGLYWSNNTAYKYYRVLGISGQLSSDSWISEIYFTTTVQDNCAINTGVNHE